MHTAKKKKIHEKDKRYNFLIKDIKKEFSIEIENLKPEEPEEPKDVFAPFGHLWTMCENCETSEEIYLLLSKSNPPFDLDRIRK